MIDEDRGRLLSRKVANVEGEFFTLLADVTGLTDAKYAGIIADQGRMR